MKLVYKERKSSRIGQIVCLNDVRDGEKMTFVREGDESSRSVYIRRGDDIIGLNDGYDLKGYFTQNYIFSLYKALIVGDKT